VLGKSEGSAFKKGTFAGKKITGTKVGSGDGPCWPDGPKGYAYRANVTKKVKGNGTFKLKGFASGIKNAADPWVTSKAPLAEGASLTEVTREIARAWDLPERLIPMSDDRVATMVDLLDGRTVSFQEYFVQLRHSVPVRGVRFVGSDTATLQSAAAAAISDAAVVVVAPSNPIVSIGPMRTLAGVDERLAARRSSVVAVSPIVGGAALKGPADRMMVELGHEASVVGVARLYRDIIQVPQSHQLPVSKDDFREQLLQEKATLGEHR